VHRGQEACIYQIGAEHAPLERAIRPQHAAHERESLLVVQGAGERGQCPSGIVHLLTTEGNTVTPR
jgi:hypothetical protein